MNPEQLHSVMPLAPQEALEAKQHSIPDEIFTAFNELIIENLRHGYAHVKQDDVVARISASTGETQQAIVDKGWLDVEELYREAGWNVTYESAAYNEPYHPPYFTFSEK